MEQEESKEPSEPYFSERDYAAPFGRYQSGNEVGTPNEVLVGREDQRAHFIDLLLRMGRRGAYLVTGQRGVGKTSFVHYCLDEYREEVYERFLRSGVGRVMFWDHAGVLLFAFCIIFVLLMISELMEIVALSTGWGKGDDPNILFGLVIIPLAVICLYPMLYARGVLEKVIESGRLIKRWGSALSATLGVLGLAGLLFFLPPFGSPALSMSRLTLACCGVYLWVQGVSFNPQRKSPQKELGWWDDFGAWLVLPLAVLSVILGSKIASFLPEAWLPRPDQEFWGNLLWGAMLLAAGAFLRGAYLRHALKVQDGKSPHRWYLAAGGLVMVTAVVCFLIAIWKGTVSSLSLAAAWLCIAVVAFGLHLSTRTWEARQSPGLPWPSFRPRPRIVLAVKAFMSVVVTLQLIHPVFDKWTPARPPRQPVGELRPATPLYGISSLAKSEEIWRMKARRVADEKERARQKLENLRREAQIASADKQEKLKRGRENAIKEIQRLDSQVKEFLWQASRNANRRDSAVFYGRREELSWVVALFLALAVLYFMEYEWIVRPFAKEREDGALDKVSRAEWEDQQPKSASYSRQDFRELARMTLPWMLYDRWLPVLTVSVNLGFEKLDHRRVVHAMLAGLRGQYHRAFCAWNSGMANLARLFSFLLLMMFVTLAGDRWFAMPPLESGKVDMVFAANEYEEICLLFRGRQIGAGMANWICKMKWGDSIIHILYYNLFDSSRDLLDSDRKRHLLFYIFPYNQEAWPAEDVRGLQEPFLKRGIQLRVYHLFLFLLFYFGSRWFLNHVPVLPYRDLLRRIDDTTDSLAARTSVTSTMGRWKPAQWLQGFFLDERVRQTEQDPVDPRTVEFVFLQILREIQGASIQLPGGRNQLVSLPTPEINFVLDELDKIGTRVDPDEAASSGGAQQAEIINAERRRSLELHRLLADMKNLLSSAPARFIFVGGRNLHDEWLADQTARQPLLTNIFTAEVYLPSLLTDSSERRDERPKLSFQVECYVANQKKRAEELYRHSWRKRWLPMVALPLESRERESFLQPDAKESKTTGKGLGLEIWSTNLEESRESSKGDPFPGKEELVEDFLQFLTYRSLGNSKKLKELLATFVRPAGRVIHDPKRRWDEFQSCDHVLFFGDTERFRIQLLARVYRHLTVHFEQALVRRDDKLVASVLYLTDFLFKFHRRAFAWSSLERADELVHIHRAPDLREVLEAIVVQWSERFLHPIRNGMYDFRFRSDMAREIEYVSRQSAEEMAAFNFTLDESQTLKAAYETNISRLGNSKEVQDLVAGLGELHEFDQEYETARLYYRRAISMLDAELEEVIGSSPLDPETSRIEIIGGVPKGQEKARRYMTWGIARLRLMLQIGMTFEHSRNLERAEMEYQNARTLASSLLLAMLDDEGRNILAPGLGRDEARGVDRLHALKHLNILFQPLFAEVWVAEKLTGGVDTSTSLAEKELWGLRCSLPFVREPKLLFSESPTEVQGSNFALIATELHNKTGDLYFIKGRQLPVFRTLQDIDERFRAESGSGGLEGYLLRAHYHYAVGLHEMRRFVTHRRRSSEGKLSLGRKAPTIVEGGWPDFVFRATGGAFNDLAECLFGRLSLLALLREWRDAGTAAGPVSVEGDVEQMVQACTRWLEGGNNEGTDLPPWKLSDGRLPRVDRMQDWVGRWRDDRPLSDPTLITFEATPGNGTAKTLALSLGFSFVGARYLEQGGYLEDAGREMLKVCETVNHLLWWGLVVKDMANRGECGEAMRAKPLACWDYLFEVALYSLKQADRLFQSSRRADDVGPSPVRPEPDEPNPAESLPSLIGRKIPVAALTQACALGLAACRWDRGATVRAELARLLKDWIGTLQLKKPEAKDELTPALRSLLKESLVRHSYPMINRLHTLRILIDDTILGGEIGDTPGKEPEWRVIAWTEELLDLEGNLNAPLHFTPLHSGTTCALVVLRLDPKEEGEPSRYPQIRHAAERALLASQEMYSMRRAFYENISDLYYLYDDFNDRQLHFNHAIQMAGAELASLLRYRLALKRGGTENPNPPDPRESAISQGLTGAAYILSGLHLLGKAWRS
jgi:hypothetical protein